MASGQETEQEARQRPIKPDGLAGSRKVGQTSADTLLRQKLSQSRLTLLWERLWPAMIAPVAVVGLFLAVSWFGLWVNIPRSARFVGSMAFLVVFIASLLPLWRLRKVSLEEARGRLDRDSGQLHRPVTATTDMLATSPQDGLAAALWRQHQQRARAAIEAIKVAQPRPGLARLDPYAVRASILLLAIVAGIAAGPERQGRVMAAFAWGEPPPPPVPVRVDAWVDPPSYTGRPPQFLTRDAAALATQAPLAVPAGSVLVLRAAPGNGVDISTSGGLTAKEGGASAVADAVEKRFVVATDGAARINRDGTSLAQFLFTAIPDTPPTIEIIGRPERGERDTLTIRYRGADDYGIATLEGRFARATKPGEALGRSLVEPPVAILNVPSRSADAPDTETSLELSEHPWAGARVTVQLVAKDDAGNEGRSQTVETVIPQRVFTNPVSKALVEQRRTLIINPDRRDRVQIALDALLIAPERFTPNVGHFIALRGVASQLNSARKDPQLLAVAETLWQLALLLEDGGLSDAERALREAQERLKEALERNASPEEIKRLTQDLNRAMNQYLREMAERAQREPNRNAEQDNKERRQFSQQDLRKITEEIERLSREGKHAEAQRLLEQLNKLMENMRIARDRQQMDPRQREMGDALDELDQMTREQQELRDKTFRENQQQNQRRRQQGQQQGQRQQPGQQGQRGQRGQQGQKGQQGEQGEQGEGEQGEGQEGQGGQGGQGSEQGLKDRQQALREQLNRMRQRMQKGGVGSGQELGDAEDAMREAEGSLGQGQNGQALDQQGRALENLRKGGQKLAEQMMQEGDGDGQADGDPNGDGRQFGQQQNGRRDGRGGRDARNEDPLGRPQRNPLNPLDGRLRAGQGLTTSERARGILEELRKRLGDTGRPALELEYLERLLRREQ
jgi:uncharacterized protein (TIGR02302 family)